MSSTVNVSSTLQTWLKIVELKRVDRRDFRRALSPVLGRELVEQDWHQILTQENVELNYVRTVSCCLIFGVESEIK